MLVRLGYALLLVIALAACNLSSSGDAQNAPTPTVSGGGQPTVTIVSPANGSDAALNQPVIVNVTATDSVGITRVQLLVNGAIVKTVSSQNAGGDRNLSVLLDYTPTAEGVLNLQVIAYRGSVTSPPAAISVNVRRAATATNTTAPVVVTQGPVINPNDPTCRVVTDTSVNLRTGPGTVYDRITTLAGGTQVPITGRVGNNTWWQVRFGTITGWVSDEFVTIYGNCANVSIPPIPPTPTPRVNATNTPTNTPPAAASATPSATPGLADLVVSNISGATSLQIPSGQTTVTSSYTVTITNTGQRSSGQFNNIMTISPGGTTQPLAVVSDLTPGQSVVLTINLTFSTPGAYTLQARTDSDLQVTEQSEVNNVGIFTLNVAAPVVMSGVNSAMSARVVTINPALVATISPGN